MIESESSKIAKESIFRHKTFELHQKTFSYYYLQAIFLKGYYYGYF